MNGFSGIITAGAPADLRRTYGVYNQKFPRDKADRADENYDVMLDGVVLNAAALRARLGTETMADTLIALWEEQQERMLSALQGSFVLCLWDKRRERVFVTGDRLCKRPMYYFRQGNRLFFSSRVLELTALLAENGLRPAYNHVGFAMMAAAGQLYDHFTYLQDVYCLRPYEYLLCEHGEAGVRGGEEIPAEARGTEAELLERFDGLFREAVRLQFEKNIEGGYRQIASLSGGMDTRSTAMMGRELGYALDQTFCYSQSGAMDETIARRLAGMLSAPFLFYPLDGGEFLLRPEEHGRRNECQMSYGGATGALSVSERLELDSAGIIHTGSFGGEIMTGIYGAEPDRKPENPFSGEAGREFALCLPDCPAQSRMNIYQLLRGCLNFMRMFEDRAEPLSPFLQEDVYEFMRTVPVAMRKRRAFYVHWMQRYLPNRLVTTYCKTRVDTPFLFQFGWQLCADRLIRLLHIRTYEMHPFQDWYDGNADLRTKLSELVEKYGRNTLPEDIREPLLRQCASGKAVPVMYGLSGLLAAWLTDEARDRGA